MSYFLDTPVSVYVDLEPMLIRGLHSAHFKIPFQFALLIKVKDVMFYTDADSDIEKPIWVSEEIENCNHLIDGAFTITQRNIQEDGSISFYAKYS